MQPFANQTFESSFSNQIASPNARNPIGSQNGPLHNLERLTSDLSSEFSRPAQGDSTHLTTATSIAPPLAYNPEQSTFNALDVNNRISTMRRRRNRRTHSIVQTRGIRGGVRESLVQNLDFQLLREATTLDQQFVEASHILNQHRPLLNRPLRRPRYEASNSTLQSTREELNSINNFMQREVIPSIVYGKYRFFKCF
jgi:hypothetical protein